MELVKTIKLNGSLGRRFGVFHELAVDSWPEMIRAMCANNNKFRQYMQSKMGSQMRYQIMVDGKPITDNQNSWKCAEEIRITPIPSGRKNGGLFGVVVGVAMMVAAFYTGGASIAAMGAFSSSVFMAGGAMVLGGIMQMISPQPGGAKMASQTDNKPSYAFGGAVNTVAAGYPVQLPYGQRTVGGALYSAGSYAEDMQ